MKFFRIDLLTLLISLFILNSCKNQDSIGLGVNSTAQLNGNLIDTSTVVINTVPEDTVLTSGIGKEPFGFFNDPLLGTTTADLATDLNLPLGGAYVPPTGTIIIDSARLIMQYSNGFYGDSITSNYTINVYQLHNKFKDSVYYNTKTFGDYSSSPVLGTLTFNVRSHDSVKVRNIITGAPDTLVKAAPQIRIPFDNNFINTYLFNASSTTLGSNAIFQNDVRGLYLTINRNKSTGPGGIIMFNSTDTLAVYYRSTSGATTDTAEVKLPLSNMAASIKHTYTTTITNELNNTNTGSRKMFYLQGTGGLRAKISFPNLLKNFRASLLKKDSDIVINRAELVITPQPGTTIPYGAIPKISMYQFDLARQRILLQDANPSDPRAGGVGVFGGFYNSTQNEYHFIITGYIQDLLIGKTVDYGTYIGPIDNTNTSSVDIGATAQVASRTAAVGFDPTSPNRIKLNIIYTKVAKK